MASNHICSIILIISTGCCQNLGSYSLSAAVLKQPLPLLGSSTTTSQTAGPPRLRIEIIGQRRPRKEIGFRQATRALKAPREAIINIDLGDLDAFWADTEWGKMMEKITNGTNVMNERNGQNPEKRKRRRMILRQLDTSFSSLLLLVRQIIFTKGHGLFP